MTGCQGDRHFYLDFYGRPPRDDPILILILILIPIHSPIAMSSSAAAEPSLLTSTLHPYKCG
jgi:hypothetical protein